MTYAPEPLAARDAFGRWRSSEPFTLFDSKQLTDALPLFYDDQETSGSGTSSSHSTARASTLMSVSNVTAGTRVRQTFRRFNYQPGKSQEVLETFVMGTGGTGITKRVGYFDENNGVFLEQDDGVEYFVIRSSVSGSPVDTRVAITSGNVDPGIAATLDFSKSQILIIDFEWLGVGTVAFGFVVDRQVRYVHFAHNANSATSVYMSTPNLPVRYEISNDGTGSADSLEHICSTVISEGGLQQTGTTSGISRSTSALSTPSSGVWYPLISLRLKSTHLGVTVQPVSVYVNSASSTDYEIALILNPTVAGADAVSWTSITNTAIQYDISRDTTNTLTGGFILGIAIATQTQQSPSFGENIDNILTIGSAIDGTQDELVLAVRRLSGASANFYAAINWRELL